MADDIDIEEHDVMDNPKIKDIFPDLSRIKTEVPDLDEEENQMDFEYSIEEDISQDHSNLEGDTFNDNSSFNYEVQLEPSQSEDREVEYRHNKIILGSKPQTSMAYGLQVETTQDAALIFGRNPETYYQSEANENELSNNSQEGHSSMIILGSKERVPEDAIVLVENWGPRLENSPCYCKDCQILFPTRNVLDAHNMASHSFLVALENEVASPESPTSGEERFCNHCNKIFPNDTSLIKHLYMIVTSDKFECDFCDKVFKSKIELNVHCLSHVQSQSHTKNQSLVQSHVKNQSLVQSHVKNQSLVQSHVKNQSLVQSHVKNQSLVQSQSHVQNQSQSSNDDELDYYRCHICSCYFRYQPLFESHLKKAHFLINNSNLTKVNFDGQCKFCPSVQKSSNYNRHVKGVHSKHYFMKSDTNSSQIRKYQCLKCNEVFTSYNSARYHRRIKHADAKNQTLFNVIVIRQNTSQSKSDNPTVTVKKSLVRFQKPSEPKKSCLVPKSILFKCDKCQIHFTSCSDAEKHSKSCSRSTGDWKCKQCHRYFRLNDIELHQQQHKVTDRFTVYTYRNHLYGRVLNQCPDCKLYFNENEFKKHCLQSCVKSKPVHCGYCSSPMHYSSVDTHYIYHKMSDFNQDGRILVEFSKTSDSTSLKMKMYYCATCGCCMTTQRFLNFHLEGKCRKFHSYVCRTCGLLFSAKAHTNFHTLHSDLKVNNLKFIRIQDRKVINPPIPKYPKCDECNVHYCRSKTARRCECTDDYKTCEICKLKFSDLAYKIHVPLHEYGKPLKYERKPQKDISTYTKIPQESVPKTEELPVLLQKYEMLTNLWNILYLCQFCDIVCDSYDMMVDHCQRHYNKMESYDVTIMNCQICDLKFDGTCFDKHLSLHAENKSINKESFQIFTYDYTQLFSKQWLDLYGTLPKAQIDQIVNRSIYYITRRFKMTVAQEGTPEFTLYKCGKCNKFVLPQSIPNHYKHAGCSGESRIFSCFKCHLPFATQKSRDLHVPVHGRIKEKPFRIVHFNNPEDCNFNKALYSEEMRSEGPKKVAKKRRHSEMSENSTETNEISFTNNKTILGKLVHYYKCSECNCCIQGIKSTRDHFCAPGSKCMDCGLKFAPQLITKHRKLHDSMPNLDKSNIRLTVFEPNASAVDKYQQDTDETVNIINRCDCGLHFISEQSYQTHSGRCSTAQNVTKENCSKCGLIFDTNELFKHLCRHHSSHKQFKFSIRDETSNPDQKSAKTCIYKCGKCNVHFLKASTYRYHFHHDHVILRGIDACKKCGLVFTKLMLPKHITTHHNILNCDLQDFIIIVPDENCKIEDKNDRKIEYTVPKRKVLTYNFGKNFYSNVLYYCNHCSQFLISRQTFKKHSQVKRRPNVGPTEKCSQCGLLFGKWTLERHMKVHHKLMKLKRSDFILMGIKGVNLKKHEAKGENNVAKNENTGKKHKLYKCMTCDLHFMNSGTLASHTHRGHVTKHIHVCKFCGLRFSKLSLNKHHILHHRKGKFNLDDVYFKTTVDNLLNENDADRGVRKISKPKINIYKCNECESHYLDRESLSKHLYRGSHDGQKCDCKICGLGFGIKTLVKHRKMHHETAKLKLKDFQIVSSDDIGWKKDSKKPVSLSNRIVFEDSTSSVDVDNDVDDQSLDTSEFPETLSIDDRETITSKDRSEPMDVDDNESYKNSIDSRKSKDPNRFITLFENTLFKCENCNVHFLKEVTLQCHTCKDIDDADLICDLCGLKFNSTRSVARHKDYHKFNNFTLKDFQIIPFSQHGDIFVNNYLFHCVECDMYFYIARNFENHFLKSNHTHTTARGKCDICGFSFSISALPKHKEIHHDLLNLNADNFIIIQKSYSKMYIENYECAENEGGEIIRESKRERVPKIFEDSIVDSNEESQSAKTDDTTVNDSSQEVDNRIYKCMDCKAHFSKIDTCRRHRILCEEGGVIQKTVCDICHYTFSAQSLPGHKRLHHELFNLSRKDLRVIECGENKNEINVENQTKRNKLYRCHKCKVHFMKYNSCVKHVVQCDPNSTTIQKPYYCETCGLAFKRFTLYKHVMLHHITLNLSRQDMRVIEYNPLEEEEEQEEEKEESEISVDNLDNSVKKFYPESASDNKLYKCGKCKIHFIKSKTVEKHRVLCGTKEIISMRIDCEICGLTFSRVTLQKHTKLHHDTLKLSLKDLCVIEYDENEFNTDTEQNISGIDNKLYKCPTCEVYFIRSATLESHLIVCGLMKKRRTIACDICGLKFSFKTFKNHKYIHHDIMNLSLKDFHVVEQYAGNVSVDKIKDEDTDTQSTTESSNNKSIELESYEPDKTLTPIMSKQSTTETSNDKPVKLESYKRFKTHTPIMSKKQGCFVSKTDMAHVDVSLYDHRIYQCVKCNVHFTMKASLMKHMLDKKNPVVANCDICGLMFTHGAVDRHSYTHHDRMKLSLEDFEIIRLDYNGDGKLVPLTQDNTEPIASTSKAKPLESISDNGEGKLKPTIAKDNPEPIASTSKTKPSASISPTPETPNRTLFKCDICNIHYANRELLLKHIKICDGSSKCDKCLICELKFSKRSLQRHIRLHHELWKLKPKDLKIITLPSTPKLRNTYDKDTDSDSIISQSTADDNFTNDESTSNTIQSDDTTEDVPLIVKEKAIEQANESEVTQSTGSSQNDMTDDKVKSKIEIKLFKCADCNVYFITQATCYKHILHHTPLDSKEYIECKLCGFQFKIITLHRHIMGHHSQNFNLEDVVVEEYKCNGENAPEITTYCAIDKVQSRLVSTTTEGNKEVNSEVDATEKISDGVTSNDSGDKPKVLEESTSKVVEETALPDASVCDNLETSGVENVPEIQKEITT